MNRRCSDMTQFRRDLGQSAGVIVSHPMLPALTAALAGAAVGLGRLGGPWDLLGLPIMLFLAGFAGTQRVWFVRGLRFRAVDADEVLPLTLAFLPRFFLLGLLVAPVYAGALLLLRGLGGSSLPLIGAALATDIALTFVTSTLALSTRSVRGALRQGFRMAGDTWPPSAWYLVTPGLAVLVMTAAQPPGRGPAAAALAAGVASLVALWFKGAVVAFYLRQQPGVRDDGAAYQTGQNNSLPVGTLNSSLRECGARGSVAMLDSD